MANYTIAVGWSGKDALADSNANKVISGADFNTEFTAVQTAVNTKADLAGSASQAFSATTAAAGTNTTQVATTAFVLNPLNIADVVYPVGAIFTTVTAYANSAAVVAVIGGTTWVAFGAGKVLVGLDSGDTDFDTSEETGGAKTDSHTLTTSEIPAHTHSYDRQNTSTDNISIHDITRTTGGNSGSTTGSTGGGGAHTHDIVQPYIVVYFWKRTA
jgi:hypothetical protein